MFDQHQKLAIALSGLCAVGWSTACDDIKGAEEEREEERTEVVATPTVEKVVDNPRAMDGRTLTLYGEADEVYGDRAFVLEGNDWIFDHELLVLTREPIDLGSDGIQDDEKLAVTGKIRNLQLVEVEKELDWDLDTELETEFENRPIMIADSITATRGMAQWTDEPEPAFLSWTAVYAVPEPEALEGRVVDFALAEVRSKTGDALWIGPSHGTQLLVAPPEHAGDEEIEVGDTVVIQGFLRKMPKASEAMERWSIPEVMKGQLAEEVLYVAATMVKPIDVNAEEKSAAATPTKSGA